MTLSELRFRRRPIAAAEAKPSDAAMLAAIALGDAEALAEIYARHAFAVYAVASRLAGPQRATDITRDVFLHLWATGGALDEPVRPVRLALVRHAYQLSRP